MKNSKLVTAVSLLAFLVSNAIAAAWTGSMSEPENMKKIDGKAFYVITTADELAWFADQVNGGKSTINAVLGNDIIFGSNTTSTCSKTWTPIGRDSSHIFNGIFDGKGFTIFGLNIQNETYTGFIGIMGTSGILKNLKVSAGNYKGKTITGGLVAINSGVVDSVINENTISGYNMGGCVGWNSTNGSVTGAHNKKDVLISISESCSYSQTISSYKYYIGGIVGKNDGFIEESLNERKINVEAHAYGNHENYFVNGTQYLTHCGVKLYTYQGGIVGINGSDAKVVKSSNLGELDYVGKGNSTGQGGHTYGYVGGIAGNNDGLIENSFNESSKSFVGLDLGEINSSYSVGDTAYWIKNVKTIASLLNMQKDQFAWVLNTANGTEENSGVWTRGTEGYPTFANEDSLTIHKIIFNDDGVTTNRYTNYKGLVSFPENPEPAEGFVFSGWYNSNDVKVKPTTVFSVDQTVNAVYVDVSDVLWTINFYNAAPADTVLETKTYQHGDVVTYGGVVPTLSATAKYTYTFKGWDVDPTNAIEDFDYHAVYDSTIRSYVITFNNSDGSKIESGTYEYGKMPNCSKTPSRTATAEWKYTHKGWKPAFDYVTGEASYVATYDSSKVEYKVTFMNGIEIIDEQMVPYGDAAVAPANVIRDGYVFTGWNTSFSKVTENLTVKALFDELPAYIIKIVDDEGVKIDSLKVVDGQTYTLPVAPQKLGYTFDAYYNENVKIGIAGDIIVVANNLNITAKYSRKIPTIMGDLVQILAPGDTFKTVIIQGVDISYRKTSNISFLNVSTGGGIVNIKGVVPESYQGDSLVVDSLLINAKVYVIKVLIQIPNEPKSSSSKAVSSSSTNVKSSSSKNTNAIIAIEKPRFSIFEQGRYVHILNARIGSAYALFDIQGHVLKSGYVDTANFNIAVPNAGRYFVRIENSIQMVNVK